MNRASERRLLQVTVAAACLVPLAAGGAGVIEGAAMLRGVLPPVAPDLDSHYRYLSGLLLGIGIVFAWCVPRIETKGRLFRALALVVIVGGLARLAGLIGSEAPGRGHLFGLLMELGAVPLLALWQARVERLHKS